MPGDLDGIIFATEKFLRKFITTINTIEQLKIVAYVLRFQTFAKNSEVNKFQSTIYGT